LQKRVPRGAAGRTASLRQPRAVSRAIARHFVRKAPPSIRVWGSAKAAWLGVREDWHASVLCGWQRSSCRSRGVNTPASDLRQLDPHPDAHLQSLVRSRAGRRGRGNDARSEGAGDGSHAVCERGVEVEARVGISDTSPYNQCLLLQPPEPWVNATQRAASQAQNQTPAGSKGNHAEQSLSTLVYLPSNARGPAMSATPDNANAGCPGDSSAASVAAERTGSPRLTKKPCVSGCRHKRGGRGQGLRMCRLPESGNRPQRRDLSNVPVTPWQQPELLGRRTCERRLRAPRHPKAPILT
jgi:hypothetical protein